MRKARKYTNEEVERLTLFSGNLRFMVRNGPINAAEVARRIGVSSSVMSAYVRGRRLPTDEVMEQIAAALGCSVAELLDDTYAPWKFGESIEETQKED